jgi:hypothetical protein
MAQICLRSGGKPEHVLAPIGEWTSANLDDFVGKYLFGPVTDTDQARGGLSRTKANGAAPDRYGRLSRDRRK